MAETIDGFETCCILSELSFHIRTGHYIGSKAITPVKLLMNNQTSSALSRQTFVLVTLITSLWINVSEVFRYFVIVRPEVQTTLAAIPNVADMNWGIFAIWGAWDTLLTAFVVALAWLWQQTYPKERIITQAIAAGSIAWILFVLFWVAMANMGLSRWAFVPIPLVLSWIEMTVGTYIALWLICRVQQR